MEPTREERAERPAGVPETRIVNVTDLMGDAREITLRHGGECYRLRITSKGKLILTK